MKSTKNRICVMCESNIFIGDLTMEFHKKENIENNINVGANDGYLCEDCIKEISFYSE